MIKVNIRGIGVPVLFLILTSMIGTVGYRFTEDLQWSDAAWLAAVSVLTIGYGDIAPVTMKGKIFTLIIIPIAIALVAYILAQFAGAIINGTLASEIKKKVMDKKIVKLHFF